MRFLLFTFLVVASFTSFAQATPAYDLKFKIHGWKDTTVYLGHYIGELTYLKDTAKVNSKGEFHFDGKKALGPGQYFLVLNKVKVLEFLVSPNSQKFTMENHANDFIKNITVTGDLDNTLFFQNMMYNAERHKEAEPFIAILKDSTLQEDKKKPARDAFA